MTVMVIKALLAAALALVPGATTAPPQMAAPAASGVRLTFYAAGATVPGTMQEAVWKPDCDPAREECWVDAATGQTIGMSDVPGSGGDGFSQVDILHLDAQTCIARMITYSPELHTGAMLGSARQSAVFRGGSCSDYWMPPAQVSSAQAGTTGGVQVLRGPSILGGTAFDAVSVVTASADMRTSTTYDTASGFLLVASSRSQGAAVPTIDNDAVVPGAGSTHLAYTRFVSSRSIPWLAIAEPLPEHVRTVNRLVYDCTTTTVWTASPEISNQQPCRMEATPRERTDLYVELETSLSQSDGVRTTPSVTQGSEVVAAIGPGGLFLAPSVLVQLTPGTVLDDDPVTGVRTSVVAADASTVTISEQTAVDHTVLTYDRASGWMLHSSVEQILGEMSFTTQFALTAVE